MKKSAILICFLMIFSVMSVYAQVEDEVDDNVYVEKTSFLDDFLYYFASGGQQFAVVTRGADIPDGWSCSFFNRENAGRTFQNNDDYTTTVGRVCSENSMISLNLCLDGETCSSRQSEGRSYKIGGVAPTYGQGIAPNEWYHYDCYSCTGTSADTSIVVEDSSSGDLGVQLCCDLGGGNYQYRDMSECPISGSVSIDKCGSDSNNYNWVGCTTSTGKTALTSQYECKQYTGGYIYQCVGQDDWDYVGQCESKKCDVEGEPRSTRDNICGERNIVCEDEVDDFCYGSKIYRCVGGEWLGAWDCKQAGFDTCLGDGETAQCENYDCQQKGESCTTNSYGSSGDCCNAMQCVDSEGGVVVSSTGVCGEATKKYCLLKDQSACKLKESGDDCKAVFSVQSNCEKYVVGSISGTTEDTTVTCYFCKDGGVTSAKWANECPEGVSETPEITCKDTKLTCYWCEDLQLKSSQWDEQCPKGSSTQKPETCEVDLVDCSTASDCGECQECSGGVCVDIIDCGDVECLFTEQCEQDEFCIGNECIPDGTPIGCEFAEDCPEGDFCIEGQCLSGTSGSKGGSNKITGDTVFDYYEEEPAIAWGITALIIIILVAVGLLIFGGDKPKRPKARRRKR